jgi:2Fe-2S ferredoxin
LPKITYIESNGSKHVVDVIVGHSLMEGAVNNGVPGILADCGGNCACGTCRVYVDDAWKEKTGEPSAIEAGMLELHEDSSPSKRLACQIKVTEDLDGLVLRLPETQF